MDGITGRKADRETEKVRERGQRWVNKATLKEEGEDKEEEEEAQWRRGGEQLRQCRVVFYESLQ